MFPRLNGRVFLSCDGYITKKVWIFIFLGGFCSSKSSLKVVDNEKGGGSGSRLLLGTGPWRSMSVYFLMLPSSFLQRISVSVCRAQLIGD
jgi:hypothetical protein